MLAYAAYARPVPYTAVTVIVSTDEIPLRLNVFTKELVPEKAKMPATVGFNTLS